MKTTKLYVLAEQLSITKDELIEIVKQTKILDNVSAFSSLTEDQVKKIYAFIENKSTSANLAKVKQPVLRKKKKIIKIEKKDQPEGQPTQTIAKKKEETNAAVAVDDQLVEKGSRSTTSKKDTELDQEAQTDKQGDESQATSNASVAPEETKKSAAEVEKEKVKEIARKNVSNLKEENIRQKDKKQSIIDDEKLNAKPIKKSSKSKNKLLIDEDDIEIGADESIIEPVAVVESAPSPSKPAIRKVFLNHKSGQYHKGSNKKNNKEKHQFNARKKAIKIGQSISISELASTIGVKVRTLNNTLNKLDIQVEDSQSKIDAETAQLVASEFSVEVEIIINNIEDTLTQETKDTSLSDDTNLIKRPPIVTVMGHVDHGKTTLLDYIRSTDIASGEQGGITQHIGANFVETKFGQICFLDTPGHAAFTAMRARGAVVTDIVILIVSADDGPMPQTIEAINHARAGEVPMIVAINKIDKPDADVEKIKQKLTEHGIIAGEYGGTDTIIGISAKSGKGIDELLEMVFLQTDLMELKANSNNLATGTIIDAQIDKNRGILVALIVQNGTMKKGDFFVSGLTYGKVRSIMNDKGQQIQTALPSYPVEILGFNELPVAGDTFLVTKNEKLAKQMVDERIEEEKNKRQGKVVNLETLFDTLTEDKKVLNLIIKADVNGSQEALSDALLRQNNSDKVKLEIIHSAVGAINASDVSLASASKAIIIGFNVRADNNAQRMAEAEHVEIRTYGIIYEIIDDIRLAMQGLLDPVFHEEIQGKVNVKEVYHIPKIGVIAGCYVEDGKVIKDACVRVLRDNIVVHDGALASLKRFKDDAKEVQFGNDCGLSLKNFKDIKVGDVLEVYSRTEQVAKL